MESEHDTLFLWVENLVWFGAEEKQRQNIDVLWLGATGQCVLLKIPHRKDYYWNEEYHCNKLKYSICAYIRNLQII